MAATRANNQPAVQAIVRAEEVAELLIGLVVVAELLIGLAVAAAELPMGRAVAGGNRLTGPR
jgi:hypothetical protein